ncbi:hypothetical protein GZH49_22345 [Nocardia terpenica]|uniref:hypothetical protein n=1 Tax=Nocardia terpenica TaxID=455432 RepID=UPI002FE133C6
MTLIRRRTGTAIAALGIVLVAMAGVSAGCGNGKAPNDKGAKVDTSLTEASARERIINYLVETLQALPPGTGLSLTSDNSYLGSLKEGFTVPCNDDDLHPDGPQHVQIRYWVVGVPTGQDAHYFQLIHDAWAARGWQSNPDSDSRWAAVHTADGYGLNVRYVPNQDHSVSVTAGSPCFPKAAEGTTAPQPTELRRPS